MRQSWSGAFFRKVERAAPFSTAGWSWSSSRSGSWNSSWSWSWSSSSSSSWSSARSGSPAARAVLLAVGLASGVAGCAGKTESGRAGAFPSGASASGTPASAASSLVPTVERLPVPRGTSGAETCFNATDDNGNGLLDEGCATEQSQVQFVVAWEESEVDVDLHVTGPSGETAAVGSATQDGLVKLRDCPGEGADCQDRNHENVVVEEEPVAGDYLVRVRLEDLAGRAAPIRVRLGIRIAGQSSAYLIRLARPGTEALLRVRHAP